jgi:ABC-type transport system involved in multi-copper enzyme maturation permease subunit
MKFEIDNNILSENNITIRKKSSVLPIAILVIATIVFVASLLIESESAKMPVMFIAIILGILGIAKIFTMPKVLVYEPNNEDLKEEELYFDSGERNNVMQLLKCGDISHLRAIAKDTSNHPLMVELVTTSSESIAIYRVYHYVPYTYEPLTEYEVYKKPNIFN